LSAIDGSKVTAKRVIPLSIKSDRSDAVAMVRKFLALFICIALLLGAIPSVQGARAIEDGYVTGNVLDPSGAPLAGVTILAVNTSSGESITTVSNATGAYRLQLSEGQYNISASLANYSSDKSYLNIDVPENITGPLNFTMTEQLCTVSGFVLAGTPVVGVSITISNAKYNYTVQTTAPFGSFIIRNIQPGVYVATAEKMGYNPASLKEPLMLSRGTSIEVNFTLDIQAAQIYGKVKASSGGVLSNVKVVLTQNDAGVSSQGIITSTNDTGDYIFTLLAAGNYTISYQKDGYQEVSYTIVLSPYQNLPYDSIMTSTKKNVTAVLFGYDLAHSFMIVAFITGFIVVVAGIFVHIRAQKKPELLATIKEEETRPPEE